MTHVKNVSLMAFIWLVIGLAMVCPVKADFSIPTLYTPANNSEDFKTYPPLTKDITFTWSVNDSGWDTDLFIAKDPSFTLTQYHGTVAGNSSVQALQADEYWWKARYYDSGNATYTGWSDVFKFTLTNTVVVSNGSIYGTVYELLSNGSTQEVNGVKVRIWNNFSTLSDYQITGSNGYYIFSNLSDGTYNLQASKTGDFEDSAVEIVTITTSVPQQKNIILQRCVSVLTCSYNKQYVTIVVRNMFDVQYPGVTAVVYKDDETTPVYTGMTDTNGEVTFFLVKDVKYKVILSGGGISSPLTIYVHGSQTEYRITVAGGFPTGGDRAQDITATLTSNSINSTYSYLSLVYKDNRSSTTAINFYATNTTTGATSWQNITSQDVTLNLTVLASGTYRFGYIATSSIYGTFREDKAINFGVGMSAFNPLAGKIDATLLHWGSVMLLFFVGAMFSVRTVKFGAVLVPMMALFMWFIGWLQVNFLLVSTAMVIGVLVYIRSSEHKVEY